MSILYLWTHFKTKMQCQRGFIITSAVAGSALLVGTAVGGAGLVAAGGVATAASLAIGAVTAAAVYTGAYFGLKGLMGGGSTPEQQAQPGFDPYAEQKQAQASADEKTKRTRIAAAKNSTKLSDPDAEAKLGTTGLLGS